MKKYTLGQHTLDEFAEYLNGGNKYFEGIEGGELIISGKHHLTKTVNMNIPLTITGEDALITGDRSENFAFSISASDTTLQNITIDGFKFCVDVDALGGHAENILVQNVVSNNALNLVDVGSSKSNSVIRNLHIEGCVANVANESWGEEDYGEFALSFNICCARYKGGANIDNCLIEDVYLNNCKKIGQSRAGILAMTGMPCGTNYMLKDMAYSNLIMRGLHITNNYLDLCWDGALSVVGGFINTGKTLIENVDISHNHVIYGIGGVGVTGGAHHFGDSGGSIIRNVTMNNNHIERGIEDVGELGSALGACASRGDYYPGIISHDYLIENVEMAYNTVIGDSISLTSAYSFLDGEGVHYNNVISKVNIHHNTIKKTEVGFKFITTHIDGRLYDWNFGWPRHDKKWGEQITDDTITTVEMTNNRIEDLTCTDNIIEGYRYRVMATASHAHGHAVIKDNKVTKNIVFERNTYGVGGNHLQVTPTILFDYVHDEGGNEVSKEFFNK